MKLAFERTEKCWEKKSKHEGTVKGVVRLMLSFWKGLPNSLEPTLNGSKEFQTYMKAILYRWIVFTIIDLLFCVIIIVLLVIAFQIYTFKGQGPNGILYPKGIQYPNSIPYIPWAPKRDNLPLCK